MRSVRRNLLHRRRELFASLGPPMRWLWIALFALSLIIGALLDPGIGAAGWDEGLLRAVVS